MISRVMAHRFLALVAGSSLYPIALSFFSAAAVVRPWCSWFINRKIKSARYINGRGF